MIGRSLVLASFILAMPAWADSSIRATVSPNPVQEDDNLQFRIEVNSENAQAIGSPSFEAPDFTEVASSSSTAVTSQYVGGQITMVEKVVYTYVLLPKKSGNLKIANITVEVGGKPIKTEDQFVNVTAGFGQGNRQQKTQQRDEDNAPPNPAAPTQFQGYSSSRGSNPERLNSDFTVHVSLNKSRAFVGEPIVAEYWLYDFGGLQSVDVQKWPTFNGFWKEDLQISTRYQFQDTYVGNQHARKALLGRFALFPIKPGKLPIDSLIINGKYVSRPTNMNADDPFSFFLGSIGQMRSGTHASEEMSVEIMPLPEQGRPESFGGAVGQFKMNLVADKQSAQANTPINLNLTIEGTGNFQAIDQFKLPLPPEFELYESNSTVNGSAPIGSSRSLENKKTFHYLVLPRKEGKFVIPSVSWSYFDPEKKSYQSLITAPITLDISPDDGSHQSNIYGGSGATPTTAPTTPVVKSELRYLKSAEAVLSNSSFSFTKVLIILFAALNTILAILLMRRSMRGANPLARFSDSPKRKLSNLLTQVEKNSTSRLSHSSQVESAVRELLQLILKRNTSGMTHEQLETEWKEKHLPAELFIRVQSLLEHAERERYARNQTDTLSDAVKKKNLEDLRYIIEKSSDLI